MDMWVMLEPARVGVEYGNGPGRALRLFVVAAGRAYRLPGAAPEPVANDLGVYRSETAPFGRQGEGQQEIIGWHQRSHSTFQPWLALTVRRKQPLALRRLDEAGRPPGFLQHVLVVELQAVEVELDRAPGVRGQQVGEVVRELRFGGAVNPTIDMLADSADGARRRRWSSVAAPCTGDVYDASGSAGQGARQRVLSSCWLIVTKYCRIKSLGIEGMKVQNNSWCRSTGLLRVAASSNPALQRTCRKRRVPELACWGSTQ